MVVLYKLKRALRKTGKERLTKKVTSREKKYFFEWLKNFPQQIENTRHIIQNMSEII